MAVPPYKKRKLAPTTNDSNGSERGVEEYSESETSDAETRPSNGKVGTQDRRIQRNGITNHPKPNPYGTYSASILQLQVDELLSGVQPDYERRLAKVEDAIHKLKGIIERIPSRDPKVISDAEREQSSHNVRIPFPNPKPEKGTKYTFAYAKPTTITIVGSYARRTAIRTGEHINVDLAVTMPSHIFQEKDYLNYRYFHKRAYYLACIASGIEEADESSFAIEYALQNENQLQPIIVVNPGQRSDDFSRSKCKIRIILAADKNLFPISKTVPNKNCIRSEVGSSPHELLPTPLYNASIRSECLSQSYLKYLNAASSHSGAFPEACMLGSVWLRQRGLRGGGFGPFEWAVTTALLMQGGGSQGAALFSRGYNSYQLFKAMIHFFAIRDLVKNPVLIKCDSTETYPLDRPVLFDGARGLNVLYKLTPWSYALLRYEADRTLKLLNDPLSDHFAACFITKVDIPLLRFDYSIDLQYLQPTQKSRAKGEVSTDKFAYCHQLYEVMKIGLADRVQYIYLKAPSTMTWSTTSERHTESKAIQISIGLLLNPEHANRTVDRGPSVEDKEAAAAFRAFWGEKAELRRFKDGSIQESLIWSTSDPRENILSQVIKYIIERHFGLETAQRLNFFGDSFNLRVPGHRGGSFDAVTLYQPVLSAFEILEKDIRGLQGLPLQIRQISAADTQLRYASLHIPVLDAAQHGMDPAEVFVQFEGSSRWPDDLAAVQITKIAFLVKMGELLQEAITGLTQRTGLEDSSNKLQNIAFLDVQYPSGALFRLRIHHEREINLIQRKLKEEAHTAADREKIASALSVYKRKYIQAPLHTQVVRTLSTRFPLLSPSIRLVKKWRDSHFLTEHISDELVELLTIRTFVHPQSWSVPGSIMTGFLRTLHFISKWDWRLEPLIVDFNGELGTQDIDAIRLRFEAWRKIDPAMNRVAMFAASNIDRDGISWTEGSPSKMIAARLTSLAKAAFQLVVEQGFNLQPEALFTPSMEEYDFLIHLKPEYAGAKKQQERRTNAQLVFKNLQNQALEDKSLIGYNPTQSYLDELRRLYDSNVLFFRNGFHGSIIAGLWNPQTGPRSWKVSLPYSNIPLAASSKEESADQVRLNREATLHDIGRLGGDMVLRIQVRE
ncbi:U3 snoRNP protein [Lecanora helva]